MTVGGVWLIGKTALGAVLVRRIEGRDPGQDLDAVHEELDDLREQIARIRDEHEEVLDRLDSTDRLLSNARQPNPHPHEGATPS